MASDAQATSAFGPLKHRAFAVLWAATVVGNVGVWMRDTASAWAMTEFAPSPLMVSAVQAAATLPVFLLSLPAGALADIVDRRRMMIAVQVAMALVSLALALLALGGQLNPLYLLILTLVGGIGAALSGPAWQTIVPELVPRPELKSAVALNSLGLNISRAIGPALAGAVLVSAGVAATYFFNLVAYAFLHRAMIHADLRIGPAVRVFAQIGAFGYDGRPNGRAPTDLDRLDLMQGFIEVSGQIGAGKTALRLGRQELSFGSSRLVAVRDGPNIRRAFDGGRATWSDGRIQIDGFVVRPVAIDPGVFDDRTDDAEHFWGVYATMLVTGSLHIDFYYLGLERDRAAFAYGTGLEKRHSLGARLFGNVGGFDWDVEAVRQFGQFAEQDIAAWTVASDIGFTVAGAPLSPRIGLKADIASGDRSRLDGKLGTFNALYPKFPYFSEANLIAPANIIDLHPSVTLNPTPRLSFDLGWNPLWRQTTADAIYAPPLRAIPGTAGRPDRFIGHQTILGLEWRATNRTTLAGQYVHFEPGETLESLGGKAGDFVVISAAHRF